MLTELIQDFKEAACRFEYDAAGPMVAAQSISIRGQSLSGILKLVLDKALALGKAYRSEIEQAAKTAVDALVAMDLPYIPPGVEGVIDEATRELGYRAIEAILDAILA